MTTHKQKLYTGLHRSWVNDYESIYVPGTYRIKQLLLVNEVIYIEDVVVIVPVNSAAMPRN